MKTSKMMSWFTKEEAGVPPVPPDNQERKRKLDELKRRSREMAIELMEALTEPTKTLAITWSVRKRDSGYDDGFYHYAYHWTVVIYDRTTFFEIIVVDHKGVRLLSETFHRGYDDKPNDGYVTCAKLVGAIQRSPDILEERFKNLMDCVNGKIWEIPEEEDEADQGEIQE